MSGCYGILPLQDTGSVVVLTRLELGDSTANREIKRDDLNLTSRSVSRIGFEPTTPALGERCSIP